MAPTAMAIYKNLPKTNCGDCKFPTCMAFAMRVAAKQKALTDCPRLSDEAKAAFSESSAPPMALVRIGPPGEGGVDIGQETVLFRHEGKFQRPTALAAKIAASLSDADAAARLDAINKSRFTRIGQAIGVGMAAIETDGLSADSASKRARLLAEKSRVPLAVMGKEPAVVAAAVGVLAGKKPLVCRALPENADAFIKIAADHKCPLAVSAGTLEQLSDMAKTAKDKGVAELILAFDGRMPAKTIREMTVAGRAALKKNFRPLGWPMMVDVSGDAPAWETVLASAFVAKYASLLIVNGLDPAELLPILTMIQNICTDPQVPNEVEAKLCEIGKVGENSPVLFTTNFALTYFSVAGEVERSKTPAYICVVDTEGLGVLNAFAGDKLSPEKAVKTIAEQKVADKVRHRKLIIPGLLPSFKAEIEETSAWKEVIIGPPNASGIPAFFQKNWR
ncbi:MAG: acetyl-CoA decarbonylase/synthase complex subunit gamma [Verrucomicrobiota bacterium]|nr:acetyl-CoA decarbonylase/synthase complex subunit gamma [Verrucomicrobiota bacterium]